MANHSDTINARSLRPELFIAGAALLVCLGFAAFTGHVWEDYWITYRASHNLATGQGLVYTPGETAAHLHLAAGRAAAAWRSAC